MDAATAKKISKWKSVSVHVRKYIVDAVRRGRMSVYQYESVDPEMYYDTQKDAYKLRQLGYNVEFYTVDFTDKPDHKVEITW